MYFDRCQWEENYVNVQPDMISLKIGNQRHEQITQFCFIIQKAYSFFNEYNINQSEKKYKLILGIDGEENIYYVNIIVSKFDKPTIKYENVINNWVSFISDIQPMIRCEKKLVFGNPTCFNNKINSNFPCLQLRIK